MRCLIVDDEPLAHEVLAKYCKDLPFIEVVADCYDAVQALQVLNRETVDVIFLDVEMPKLQGFDFLRTLTMRPHIVMISAHREYALEGYDFNVVDYLLKPFSFERFLRAVNKVRARMEDVAPTEEAEPERHETIFIKDERKHHRVPLSEITHIEACRNYCLVFLTDGGHIMTAEKISEMAARLPSRSFVRIHRSYVVAVDKLTTIGSAEVSLGALQLPVGRVYKSNLKRLLE